MQVVVPMVSCQASKRSILPFLLCKIRDQNSQRTLLFSSILPPPPSHHIKNILRILATFRQRGLSIVQSIINPVHIFNTASISDKERANLPVKNLGSSAYSTPVPSALLKKRGKEQLYDSSSSCPGERRKVLESYMCSFQELGSLLCLSKLCCQLVTWKQIECC